MLKALLAHPYIPCMVVAVAIFTALLSGCQNGDKAKTTQPPESPGQMTVRVGEVFTVWTKSNPTTGFEWQLAAPLNSNLLKMQDTGFQAPPKSEGLPLVGAPGQQWWRLEALAPGQTAMEIAYRRSWERNQPPAEARTYRITIKP